MKQALEEIKTELIYYRIQAIVENIASMSAWEKPISQNQILLREASS